MLDKKRADVIRLSLCSCCRQHGRSASPSNNFLLWHSFVANPFDGFSVMRYVAHNQVYRLQEHSPVLQSRYEFSGKFIEVIRIKKKIL